MPEPTGNRWRDPDTGEIANKQNIDLGTYQGKDAAERKYGPAITGKPRRTLAEVEAEAKEVRAAALAKAGVATDDDLPEVPPPRFGPAVTGELASPEPPEPPAPPESPAADMDYQEAIALLAEHGPQARRGDSEATAILNRLAAAEYAREDPRPPIVNRLAAFGVKKPRGSDG